MCSDEYDADVGEQMNEEEEDEEKEEKEDDEKKEDEEVEDEEVEESVLLTSTDQQIDQNSDDEYLVMDDGS